ncbi:MAG TPA: MarR family winged helix-turn-helix transcriptional regulator [Afipia sp.]
MPRTGGKKARPQSRNQIPEPSRCNSTALRKATRRISQLYDSALAPCGLRSTQRSIMIQVERSGKPSMGELADALVINKSALAHNLKPLERDGLIVIAVDSDDRRSRRVALTKRGAARLKESKVLWDSAQRRFEAAFGVKKSAELRQVLAVIASPEFEAAFDGMTAF